MNEGKVQLAAAAENPMSRLASYLWNVAMDLQRSALLPSSIRGRVLRMLGCPVSPSSVISRGVFIGSKHVRLGPGVFVNVNCFLDGAGDINIEEYARIGPSVKILTGTHTYQSSVIRRGPNSRHLNLPVTIERGSWIGMGAMILPGVTIAEGCVIAAGAVVIRSTSPNGMYAGNPARRIKDLPVDADEGVAPAGAPVGGGP